MNCIAFAQNEPSCDWNVIVTASNATIAIQQENFDNMTVTCVDDLSGPVYEVPMSSINCTAWLGVFYTDDNGQLQCGGYTEWDSTQSFALAAWGDDPTTPEKDGFSDQEPYTFQLCVDSGALSYYNAFGHEMSSDPPFTNTYSTNGFGNITWLQLNGLGDLLCSDVCVNQTDIHEYSEDQELIKTVDLYGRDISATNSSGFVIKIFSDQTVSKTYRF